MPVLIIVCWTILTLFKFVGYDKKKKKEKKDRASVLIFMCWNEMYVDVI